MAKLRKLNSETGQYEVVLDLSATSENEGIPNVDLSSLNGKYGLHIGDSYTYALANTNGALNVFNQSIGVTSLNNGIVSSTIRDKSDKNNTGYSYKPMVCRVLNEDSGDTTGQTIVGNYVPLNQENVGYITFMGGTNDSYSQENSVGTDIVDGDKTHIYGAMNLILQKLVDSYPNIPIIVVLQPPCANDTSTESAEGVDVSKCNQSYRSIARSQRKQKAVREVAEIYAKAYPQIQVVDCCFNWYSPLDADELKTYWSSDLLHLTGEGYKELVTGTKYDSIEKGLKRAIKRLS